MISSQFAASVSPIVSDYQLASETAQPQVNTSIPEASDYFDYLSIGPAISALANQRNLSKYLANPRLTRQSSEIGISAAYVNLTSLTPNNQKLFKYDTAQDELHFSGFVEIKKLQTKVFHKNLPPAVIGHSIETIRWSVVITSVGFENTDLVDAVNHFFAYCFADKSVEDMVREALAKEKGIAVATKILEMELSKKLSNIFDETQAFIHVELHREFNNNNKLA